MHWYSASTTPIGAPGVISPAVTAIRALLAGGVPRSPTPQAVAPWTETALAQAALLLLLDCDFGRAFAALDRCGPATFQPAQLLPLFPHLCDAAWLQQAPKRSYWGLHGHRGLQSLEQIVSDHVELRDATAPRPQQHDLQQRQRQGDMAPTAPPTEAELCSSGMAAVAAYLQRARLRLGDGVVMAAAVDLLLLRLLAELGDAAALEALVARPQRADFEAAAEALRVAGRWHALALLQSCAGRHTDALETWRVRCSPGRSMLASGSCLCVCCSAPCSSPTPGENHATHFGCACRVLTVTTHPYLS